MSAIPIDDIRTPPEGGAGRRPLPVRLLVIAVSALVLGAAITRWASAEPNRPAPTVSAATPRSPADAVVRYERVVRAEPDNPVAWQSLAISAVQAVAAGEPLALYNRAETALARAESLAPGEFRNDIAGGYLSLARHDFAGARTRGLAAHAADPYNAEALAILVDAEIELGLYDDAERSLQSLFDLRPGLAANSRLSYFRELHGDVEGAREAFALAEIAGAGSAQDVANVALLRSKVAATHLEVEEARDALDRAQQYVPGIDTTVGAARIALTAGEFDEAERLLEHAMAVAPSADAAEMLRDLRVYEGTTTELEELDAFLDANADEEIAAGADVRMERAFILAERGDAAALPLAREAFDNRPNNIFTAGTLAWALHKAGDDAAALAYAERSVRLGTQDALLRFHAAIIFAANDARAAAADELRAALGVSPAFALTARAEACALDLGVECERG
jgi:tetratricopeptide (TPR) repeat protein